MFPVLTYVRASTLCCLRRISTQTFSPVLQSALTMDLYLQVPGSDSIREPVWPSGKALGW